jgi:hypothetical protein
MAAETAYGGIQEPMQSIVGWLSKIWGVAAAIFNSIAHPIDTVKDAYDSTVEGASRMMDDIPIVGKLIKDLVVPPPCAAACRRVCSF